MSMTTSSVPTIRAVRAIRTQIRIEKGPGFGTRVQMSWSLTQNAMGILIKKEIWPMVQLLGRLVQRIKTRLKKIMWALVARYEALLWRLLAIKG